MLNILKLPVLFALSLLLVSCSTSTNSERQINQALYEEATFGRVFVVRDTGSPGILNKISVIHNGRPVGDIGMKETSVINSAAGINYLTASMKGLAGLTTKDAPILTYESRPGQNKFFVIQLFLKTNGADLYFVEVNETHFRSIALNTSWIDYL